MKTSGLTRASRSLLTVTALAALALSGCGSPTIPVDLGAIASAADFHTHLDGNYAPVPLTTDSHRTRFYIDVLVNGATGKFLLDTGARRSFVAGPAMARFDLLGDAPPETEDVPAAPAKFSRERFRSFSLGGLVAVDPAMVEVRTDTDTEGCDGVIGLDILVHLHAAVDFKTDRLYITEHGVSFSASLAEVAEKAGLSTLPLARIDGPLTLDARVDDRRARFVVATGFRQSAIDSSYTQRTELRTYAIPGVAAGFARRQTSFGLCAPKTFTAGDFGFQNFPLLILDLGYVRRENPGMHDLAGVLGTEVFAKNHAVLDLDNSRVYFERKLMDMGDAGTVPGEFPESLDLPGTVRDSAAIFAGKPVSITFPAEDFYQDDAGRAYAGVKVEFEITKSFRGDLSPGNRYTVSAYAPRGHDMRAFVTDELHRTPETLVFLPKNAEKSNLVTGKIFFAESPVRGVALSEKTGGAPTASER